MRPAADIPRRLIVAVGGNAIDADHGDDSPEAQKAIAARTAEAWLANLDRNRREARKLLAKAYGPRVARRKLTEWRNVLMACAELGAYAGGNEWLVAQYRLRRRYA